jgi:hypothetical protein
MVDNGIITLSTKNSRWNTVNNVLRSNLALLICKPNQKAGRHVLMIKFGRSGKTGLSGLLFWNIWFWQFQSEVKEEAKFEEMAWTGCKYCRLWLSFGSWSTVWEVGDDVFPAMTGTCRSSNVWQLWCTWVHCGCLGRKRGSLGTSSAVARGSGETNAVGQQGVVAVTTWAPVRASSYARETQSKAGN